MKKILIVSAFLFLAFLLAGCGGGSSSSSEGRSLKAGDWFEFDKYTYSVTSTVEYFNYYGKDFKGRFIDVRRRGSYDYSMVWFERDLDRDRDNGARYLIEEYRPGRTNEVVCIIPEKNLRKGDEWYFDYDHRVYVTRVSYFRDDRGEEYKVYEISGDGCSIYYEYSPDLGFFSYYNGERLYSFIKKSVEPTKAEPAKTLDIIKKK